MDRFSRALEFSFFGKKLFGKDNGGYERRALPTHYRMTMMMLEEQEMNIINIDFAWVSLGLSTEFLDQQKMASI